MFWKLACCIMCMGIFGCSLLAMRQARLQAAHEMAQTQLRIRAADERLFKIRTEIGLEVRPDNVRSLVAGVTSLKPIIFPRAENEPATTKAGTKGADAKTTDGKSGTAKPTDRKTTDKKPGTTPAKPARPTGRTAESGVPAGSRTNEVELTEGQPEELDREPLLAYEQGTENE